MPIHATFAGTPDSAPETNIGGKRPAMKIRSATATVNAVGGMWLAYVAELFARCSFSATSSRSGANILYGVLIGLEALATGELADLRADMLALLSALLESGERRGA